MNNFFAKNGAVWKFMYFYDASKIFLFEVHLKYIADTNSNTYGVHFFGQISDPLSAEPMGDVL